MIKYKKGITIPNNAHEHTISQCFLLSNFVISRDEPSQPEKSLYLRGRAENPQGMPVTFEISRYAELKTDMIT